MKNESMKTYIVSTIVNIIVVIFLGIFLGNTVENVRPHNPIQRIDIEPVFENDVYEFSFTLPEKEVEGRYLSYKTTHFETEVLIDGQLVYSLKADNPKFSKSTSYHWNFIELKDGDEGKPIVIRMLPVYSNSDPDNEIYIGEKTEICKEIIGQNGPKFMLAVLIFIVGAVMLVYTLCILEKQKKDETLLHFSAFSLLLAIWSMMESPISELIPVNSVYNLIIDHYALMFMPVAFMMFMRRLFNIKTTMVWVGYSYFNILVVVVRTVLQLTAVMDLKESLWMTQLSIMLFAILGTGWVVRSAMKGHLSKSMKKNLFWILMLFIATLAELFIFVVFHKNTLIGMIGFACYVVVMSVKMVKQSRKEMRYAHEAELYRKLAFTDELTGTYNRTAFGRDMGNRVSVNDKTGSRMILPTTMFMLDLNDLKVCNDSFGHENGDKYIKMIADVLLDVIGVDGKCYRIGGDEFCVILPTDAQNEIDNKLIAIIQEVADLDKAGFVVPVSVAVGYATYSAEYDESLEDTMKRADALMYQNKQMIKKNRQKKENK